MTLVDVKMWDIIMVHNVQLQNHGTGTPALASSLGRKIENVHILWFGWHQSDNLAILLKVMNEKH